MNRSGQTTKKSMEKRKKKQKNDRGKYRVQLAINRIMTASVRSEWSNLAAQRVFIEKENLCCRQKIKRSNPAAQRIL